MQLSFFFFSWIYDVSNLHLVMTSARVGEGMLQLSNFIFVPLRTWLKLSIELMNVKSNWPVVLYLDIRLVQGSCVVVWWGSSTGLFYSQIFFMFVLIHSQNIETAKHVILILYNNVACQFFFTKILFHEGELIIMLTVLFLL